MGPEYNQSVQSIQNCELLLQICQAFSDCNFVFECIWKDWGHLHCNALEAIKSMRTCKANASPKDLHCDQQQIDAKLQSFTVAEIFQPVKSSVWILNWAGASFLYSRIARPAPPLPKFTDFNATHACQHDTHTLLGANPRPLLVPCCLKAKLFTMGWFQLITLLDFGFWKWAPGAQTSTVAFMAGRAF